MPYQELTVSPNRELGLAVFHAVQGESNARELRMDLVDAQGAGVPVTMCQAFLYVIKQDHNVAVIQCETGTHGKSNQVSCVLTYQATTCPGKCALLLQVMTSTGDLRYDNMRLEVAPCAVDGIISRTEFSALTDAIRNAGTVEAMLAYSQEVAGGFQEILSHYADDFRPNIKGTFNTEESAAAFRAAMDTEGNMLLLNTLEWGGKESQYSTDGGKTWAETQHSAPEENVGCQLVLGGKKFLVIHGNHAVFGQVVNGVLTWGAPIPCGVSWNNSLSALSGEYAGGKYFVCYPARNSMISNSPVGRNLFYFDDSGNLSEVLLPDPRMEAQAVGYDPVNRRYLAAGAYAYAVTDDLYNHKAWVLASDDLARWSTVYEDDMTTYNFTGIKVYNGQIVIATNLSDKIITGAADAVLTGSLQLQKMDQGGLVLAGEYGMAFPSAESMLFSRDGVSFSEKGPPFAGESETVYGAMSGRLALLACGKQYAVYRLDLIGENLKESMEKLESQYREYLKNMEQAAGYRIKLVTKDPGTGTASTEPDGTILFVTEG